MAEFHKIWIEQCQAATRIREDFGVEKALGYLIGEKLANFVRMAEEDLEYSRELPNFIAEIKRIFSQIEITEYLDGVKRIGALGHVLTDEQYALFEEAEEVSDTPAQWAEDILTLERISSLLSG